MDGASNPAPAGEATEGYLPTPTLMHSEHADVETDPAQSPPSTSATAAGPAPRPGDMDEGWKKVERKRKGKERREGQDLGERWASSKRFLLSFLCHFFGFLYLPGKGLGGGQRGACNVPPLPGQRTGTGTPP